MAADMEMPDPEELEWMESNGLLPEEEEYAYFDDPAEGFLPAAGDACKPPAPPQETATSPAKPADEVSDANLKRPPPPPPPEQEEDRSKRRNVDRVDSVDEDWLRYSPPPAAEAVAEKIVSRFASEIQGDSMPVTAPNGERVYAKLATEKLVSEVIEGTGRRTSISNHDGFSQNHFIR
ncbi:unnamed protein product [Triticum turgidum subsp. durum]|uniref:Uncharacterized protein n=1 Tax=Triticum turgidum subsp. durum TaxID=4567 RepID=A0A9R0WD72_TRITD|nr:unnamed protein product [Triticum turgidum subsp. durum]